MATTETVVQADPQHYVWWFPGSPVKVHLQFQVIQRLQERLRNAQPSIAEEGLLFGRTVNGASEILDFQAAISGTIANILAALPNEKKRSLIGYYRTEEGEAFHLNAKDHALAEESFTQPHHVFLMVHSNGFGPPNATFFFHDGDRRMADFAFLEFPFDPSLLALEEHDRIQRSHQAAIEQPVTTPLPAPIPPAAEKPRRKTGAFLKTLRWTCFAVTLFTLGMFFNNTAFHERYSQMWRAISHPAPTSLPATQPLAPQSMALHATRRDGDLELTWNRESAVIGSATSAVLSIQDGESKRLVPLDSAQVRGGNLLYSPVSDQIQMQLTVKTPGDTVSESVMVILPKVGKPQVYPLPSPPAHTGSPAPSLPPPSDEIALTKASKAFTAPPLAKPASSPDPVLAEPPATPRVNPVASAAILGVAPQAPVPPPPAPEKPTQPLLQQQSAIKPDLYEPSVPVTKIVPVFPRELQNLAVKQTVVQVKVIIDRNGKVTKAEAITTRNINRFLLNSATDAARLWRFLPARHNHEAITSESILEFVFSH